MSTSISLLFKLGSFNVQSLTQRVKQEQLCRDMKRYGIDVCSIKETKTMEINRDITITKQHNPQFRLPNLKTELDLRNIRVKATNRKHWQKIVRMVTDAAYAAMV